MSDIVDRLRVCAAYQQREPRYPTPHELLTLAADEIVSLRAAVQHEADCVEAAREEIERLRAEVERLKADAARYRWLRHGDNDEVCLRSGGDGNVWLLRNDDLDISIDTAMAQEQKHD